MVVADTFRERVLAGCVPWTVAVGDNPFGLCKVPATFERLKKQCVREQTVTNWLDGMIAYTECDSKILF